MDLSNCEKHGAKGLILHADEGNKYLCKICTIKSKEQLKFYLHHRDQFQNVIADNNKHYQAQLKEYEGFCHANKTFVDLLQSFNLESNTFIKATTNKELLRKAAKEGIVNLYSTIISKFETTIDDLTEKTEKLDLSLKTAKEEISIIERNLQDQLRFFENKTKLDEEFNGIFTKVDLKLKYSSIEKIIDPSLKISFVKSSSNLKFRSGTSIIQSIQRNNGSYYCETSEEIFDAELFVRLKIIKIKRKSDWSLNIGLIRSTSENNQTYYADGVFFMCSGKITIQFSGNPGRTITGNWNNGDEIIIRRDSQNSVFFGINDETNLILAYPNIRGQFRICVGFSSSMHGDIIEMLEVEH